MKPEDLKNRMISIQVSEPWDWKQGILTGRISEIDIKGLTISLTKSIGELTNLKYIEAEIKKLTILL